MTNTDVTRSLTLESQDEAVQLFGQRDQHLRQVRDALGVRLVARGDVLQIDGSEHDVELAERAFEQFRLLLRRQGALSAENVRVVLSNLMKGDTNGSATPPIAAVAAGPRSVRPRTEGQAVYTQAMRDNDVVLAIGPAGTGKTYLAVGMAVTMLRQGAAKRIVLVRPAVEAGEKLGFLPGDIAAKVNPYLRPLFDALNDLMEPEQVKRYMESDVIEIAPLAFMRGRTLNQAVIILDEGQNTTIAQMRMFLTRMGNGSKIIVTGDVTQVDLPEGTMSGLTDAIKRLNHIDKIGIVWLSEKDIVRHPLVQKIVKAYEDTEKTRRRRSEET